MVTQKELKNREFSNIVQYFDYVLESIVNGQRKQARDLVSCMSQRQRNQFAMYLDNDYPSPLEKCVIEAKQMMSSLK